MSNNFFKRSNVAADYREEAKEICDKHVDKLAITYLVYLLISVVVMILDDLTGSTVVIQGFEIKNTWFNGVFTLICGGGFSMSLAYIAVNVYKGISPKVENLFEGFKSFTKAFLLGILQTIYIALWFCLLFVPGIIKVCAYAMSYFIALDNPELSANECITESRRIMSGHKWDYFCLVFSYFGWLILCALTCGILYLWVGPRMMQATYLFYLDITGKGLELENEQ